MPKLALLVLFIITIDQIKVSMMLFNLPDYQQYIAAILGIFVGATHATRYSQVKEDIKKPLINMKHVNSS